MTTPNGQAPLDYLNEIAPQAPKRAAFSFQLNFRNIIILAIVAIILVIILANVANAINSAHKTPWEQLAARLTFTATVADDASTKIKSSQLRSLNSDLKLYLSNTQRDLATPLGKVGVNAAKLPKSITTEETDTAMTDRLETARLNAKYDSGYAREMSYKLATILSLLQELSSRGGSSETQAFLQNAYNNLKPTQQAIADFTDVNE
ncbi:MAG TPA: hypothetical protein VN081_00105 [Dongiaceae bacterium]|nr:hypothetical protein [Dongiaceae bacterium]